jgi:orotidine-5'-phosphate decarboxylase
MPELFGGPSQIPGSDEAIRHLEAFAHAVLDAAAGRVPAIKPQVAFFERHGPEGLRILAKLSASAKQRDLLVIMDGKRGDIGTTAQAYAEAWLGSEALFAADALTINPYLGFDSLEPFLSRTKQTQSGVFILVRTSNPGSADLQQQQIEGRPVWAHMAARLAEAVSDQTDPSCELSSVGIVMGATGPEDALAVRQLLPAAPFLIPGYGIQGAGAAEALSGLTVNRQTGIYKDGLVNASRVITHGDGVQRATTATAAVKAMQAAIEAASHDLALPSS